MLVCQLDHLDGRHFEFRATRELDNELIVLPFERIIKRSFALFADKNFIAIDFLSIKYLVGSNI